MEKNLSAVQETWIQILGWKDPLEKGLATHSSVLAWEIPWTEEPCGPQSIGLQKCQTWLSDWTTTMQREPWAWLQLTEDNVHRKQKQTQNWALAEPLKENEEKESWELYQWCLRAEFQKSTVIHSFLGDAIRKPSLC